MNYLLFNPLADNGNGEKTANEAKEKLKDVNPNLMLGDKANKN